jgi:hypothetical protein
MGWLSSETTKTPHRVESGVERAWIQRLSSEGLGAAFKCATTQEKNSGEEIQASTHIVWVHGV